MEDHLSRGFVVLPAPYIQWSSRTRPPPTRTHISLHCLDQDIDIGIEMHSQDFSLVLLDQEAKQERNKMNELDNELII